MVEDPLATADCLQITREVGFDSLLSSGKPYTNEPEIWRSI